MVKKVLTINYSDSTCKKGIQNDLTIFHQNNVFGFSAITNLTTPKGDSNYYSELISHNILEQQLESVFSGGLMDATKIGVINTLEDLHIMIKFIKTYNLKNITLNNRFINVKVSLKEEIMKELFPLISILILTVEDLSSLTNQKNLNTSEDIKRAMSKIPTEAIIVLENDLAPNFSYLIKKEKMFFEKKEKIENISARITAKLGSIDFLLN